MVHTMNAKCFKIERSHGYIIYHPIYITYMDNLHMFNHYNVEAFTYHILLKFCVIYDTMECHNIFYIHDIICYMYVLIYVRTHNS